MHKLNSQQVYCKYEHHHCVCHSSIFRLSRDSDLLEQIVKLTTLLTTFIFTLKLAVMVRDAFPRFPTLVVFGQSQCTGSAGKLGQTVGRRGFVENVTFERGGA